MDTNVLCKTPKGLVSMLDARQIMNWFIERARADGRVLSIMSLLKLIFISHGWHLEIFKRPLFANRVEAWKFGPVVPDAYYEFRKQGVNITEPVNIDGPEITDRQQQLLEEIYNIYSRMGAFKLSEITHVPGGPWETASKQSGYFAEIPNGLTQNHYENLRLLKSAREDAN